MTEGTGGDLEQRRTREEAAGLWPIGRALAIASAGVAVGLTFVTVATLAVLGFPSLTVHKTLSVNEFLDVLKLVLGTVAGGGALAALVMSYRRQRLAEVAEIRERKRTIDERVRVFNERFATAAGQLGHAESAVRLAGVYALASLADDWQQQRKACVEILCAYIRMPYEPATAPSGEKEVRHSIIRVIRDHLRPDASATWQGYKFDFTGATFDGGDFSDIEFMHGSMSFRGAHFTSGVLTFHRAKLGNDVTVYFGDARVSGGALFFSGVTFLANAKAWISFPRVRLEGGELIFGHMTLDSGQLVFHGTQFLNCEVEFFNSFLSGGSITFQDAEFSGGRLSFPESAFDGTAVSFRGAKFSGGLIDISEVSSFEHPPEFDGDAPPSLVRLPPSQ